MTADNAADGRRAVDETTSRRGRSQALSVLSVLSASSVSASSAAAEALSRAEL